MREPSDVRRQRILAVVRSRGAVRVSDLASELEVSMVTVRRDVEELARAGKLHRGHGVARSVVPAERIPGPAPEGGAVALVIPERHTYLQETMHGARTVLEEAGMRVVLHPAPQVAGAERPIVERVLAGDVRGLLFAPRWRTVAEEEADAEWLARVSVPTVLMERRPRAGSGLHAMDSVCSDHWYGMRLAVEHLVLGGHRRIVLAARDDSPTARTLRAAFAELVVSQPEIEDSAVILSAPDSGLVELVRERGFTAAVLHGDVDALILVRQLADAGVRVPKDCSVVAYDDVVAMLGNPPLTAVAPPKAQVGRVAAGLLLERLRRPGPVSRVQLLPELKVRDSSLIV
jgi:DNA-binding LacI/PurR family transcriptional regulator